MLHFILAKPPLRCAGMGDNGMTTATRYIVGALIVCLSAAVAASTVACRVVSGSMLPSIRPGDHIVAVRTWLPIVSISRGSVIIFRSPTENGFAIKRVIGMPGDQCSNGVCGSKLSSIASLTTSRLADGYIYVTGDNSKMSIDSRNWGPISTQDVVGKVVAVLPTQSPSRH